MSSPVVTSFINGQYLSQEAQADFFEVLNPATAQPLAKAQIASTNDLQLAIEGATAGQKIWASMTAMERSRIMRKAVELLRANNDELALLETRNTGKSLSETSTVDIMTGADVLEYYAGLAPSIEGEQYPLRDSSFFYTRREPLGVVAGIGAWNYPIQIALWKSAPALAAGNAMLFKPSEVTPLTTLKLAEIYQQAGLPDGVFNVLLGAGELGAALASHPHIEKISFTGGVETGKKVMANSAASSLKETTMELGGKSPLIICDDADFEQAVDIAMMANFYSSGQVCTNGTRVFIPEAWQARFEQALQERIQRIRIGDPEDPNTNFGPLCSFQHLDKVLHYLELGKQEGARIVAGGQRAKVAGLAAGAFVEPTVFSDCHDQMRIVQEEIFGPVMCLLTYQTLDEAIERANHTHFGLAAGVVTTNIVRAHQIIHQLQAGICWINSWGESPAEMPVGGFKQSGVGRENGLDSLRHYTRTKSVLVEMAPFESVF